MTRRRWFYSVTATVFFLLILLIANSNNQDLRWAFGFATVPIAEATEKQRKNWFLIVDEHCLDMIQQQRPCRSPIRTASIGIKPVNYSKHVIVTYQMESLSTWDFVKFRGVENSSDLRAVAGVKLENGERVDVALPPDIDLFRRRWRKSRFLDCPNAGVVNRAKTNEKQVIPLSAVSTILAPFRDFADKNNRTAFLLGGTLLGWYRECTIISHTTDLDLGMMISNYSVAFEELMRNTHLLYWVMGDGVTSMLISFLTDTIKTDVFFVNHLNDSTDFVGAMKVPNRQLLFWLYPKINEICSADLLGSLMYVPCNVENIILADYGPGWRNDEPSSTYHFEKSGKNIVNITTYGQTEWQRVYRPQKGFH